MNFHPSQRVSARQGRLDRRQTQTRRRQAESLIVPGKSEENFSLSSFYNGATNDPAPCNHFEYRTFVGPLITPYDIVTNLTDRYQVMSYAAESRSTALGATPNILNISDNLDLTTIWPTDSSGHSYSDHIWHSAQFRGSNSQQWGYWNALLHSSRFGFNIGN